MTKDQAQILLDQLGGNKFVAMTGAKGFTVSDFGLTFKIGRNNKGVNAVRINLNWMDLYDMEFMTIRRKDGIPEITKLIPVNSVYFDQLQDVFTAETGLYTHL
jgi:hypothetical protein